MQDPSRPNPLYIGYLPKMPARFKPIVRNVMIVVGIALVFFAYFLVSSQKGFSTANFEFGSLTEIEGVLLTEPVPSLSLINEENPASRQEILLVSFGKTGARNDIRAMEEAEGTSLHGAKVRLSGTLIYGDGKTLLELTERNRSLMEVIESAHPNQLPMMEVLGEATFKGEIIDPKCYFGVMKPGDGKIHRSCAVRCIAGGIPPVLKVASSTGAHQYHILLGPNGEYLNDEVLKYVSEPIEVGGRVEQFGDWKVLYTDFASSVKRLE